MAKFKEKIVKKKEATAKKSEKTDKKEKKRHGEKLKELKSKKENFSIWDFCAEIVVASDEILDEADEILKDGVEDFWNVTAGAVYAYDKLADVVAWAMWKTFVSVIRKTHNARIALMKYRKELIKHGLIFFVVLVCMVAVFASATDYEYSYNGRALGIVKEQKDVLGILSLVSEELSHEYGSNISINPETDITFKPVVSIGKEIDDPDTVLKRFTYMGDIQAQAYAITVDGELISIVESKKIAEDVLQSIKDMYVKKTSSTRKYEEISFKEDVQIVEYSTTLAKISSKNAAVKKIKSGRQQESTYTVKSGDTLYGICDKLDVTLKELKEMNPKVSEDMVLHVGDKFVTQAEVPLVTVVTVEVSTFAEKVKYETEYRESSSYYKGEQVVQRAGENGKAKITARLTKENGKIVDREDLNSEIIKKPVSKIVVKGTKPVPPKKGTGVLQRPVNVGVYAGYGWRWGRMHYGIDYAASTGTPIHAADGGTVVSAGWSGAYGLRITIDHGGNIKTLYAHCSSIYVGVGEQVYKGQTIAAVGSTGRSTGPHCHFEVFKNGVNVNPSNYV